MAWYRQGTASQTDKDAKPITASPLLYQPLLNTHETPAVTHQQLLLGFLHTYRHATGYSQLAVAWLLGTFLMRPFLTAQLKQRSRLIKNPLELAVPRVTPLMLEVPGFFHGPL